MLQEIGRALAGGWRRNGRCGGGCGKVREWRGTGEEGLGWITEAKMAGGGGGGGGGCGLWPSVRQHGFFDGQTPLFCCSSARLP